MKSLKIYALSQLMLLQENITLL